MSGSMQGRFANALAVRPWQARTGNYPFQTGGPIAPSTPPNMGGVAPPAVAPVAPPMMQAPQQRPPVMMGYNDVMMDTAQREGVEPVASPNQTLEGMLQGLVNVGTFAMNPVAGMAGFLAQAAFNPTGTAVNPMGVAREMRGEPPLGSWVSGLLSGEQPGGGGWAGSGFGAVPTDTGLGFGGSLMGLSTGFDEAPAPDVSFAPAAPPSFDWGAWGGMGDSAQGPSTAGHESTPGIGADPMGAGPSDGPGLFRYGGYTGGDYDGVFEPAGIVHEHEVVLRPEAVQHYGKNELLRLNRMETPRNALRRR